MAPTAISLRPSEAVQGGLIDDIDAKITDAKFIMYDYNGTVQNPTPALGLELELSDGVKHEEYFSAGDSKYWAPSGDGKTLVPTGDKTHLTNTCKLVIFLGELVNAGFSEDKLGAGDITCLVGLKAHFQRKADPKRQGLQRTGKNADREYSTLVVTKILGMPGEAEKPQAAASKPVAGQPSTNAAAPAAAAPAASGDVNDAAINTMLELLPANGGSIAKNKLSALVFKLIGKGHAYEAIRNAVTQEVFKDAFLKTGADAGLWAFDGTTVSLPQ